jgi:hypothetical protein
MGPARIQAKKKQKKTTELDGFGSRTSVRPKRGKSKKVTKVYFWFRHG